MVGEPGSGPDGYHPVNAGLVVVDKPAGMTSHDVVGRCRRIFGTRRVGHAGTLDPMATGVLVIGIERATKILGLVTETSKSYAATIRLGQSTSSEDAETAGLPINLAIAGGAARSAYRTTRGGSQQFRRGECQETQGNRN